MKDRKVLTAHSCSFVRLISADLSGISQSAGRADSSNSTAPDWPALSSLVKLYKKMFDWRCPLLRLAVAASPHLGNHLICTDVHKKLSAIKHFAINSCAHQSISLGGRRAGSAVPPRPQVSTRWRSLSGRMNKTRQAEYDQFKVPFKIIVECEVLSGPLGGRYSIVSPGAALTAKLFFTARGNELSLSRSIHKHQ